MEKIKRFFEELSTKLGLESFFVWTFDERVRASYDPSSGIVLWRYGHVVAQTGRYGPWAKPGATEEAELALEELARCPYLFIRWVDWEEGEVHEAGLPNPLED